MKKSFLILSVLALFQISAFSQSLSGGLRLGANIAKQKIEFSGISDTSDPKVDVLAGGYLTAMINEKIGLQPELVYSGMGSKDGFNMAYLAIPVFLRFNVTENVNVHLGPQLNFLLSAKTEEGGFDVKEAFKGTDFGATFGIGFDLGIFNAGVRYYLGISDIIDSAALEDVELDGLTIKNNSIQLFVGLKLFGE